MQAESASLKRGSHSNPLVAFQKCVIQNAEGKVMFKESSLFVLFFLRTGPAASSLDSSHLNINNQC